MADYTDWDINDYLPGQPLTSAKAISFHENLDATAEGATGAPRVQGKALGGIRQPLEESLVANPAVELLDLDDYKSVSVMCTFTVSAPNTGVRTGSARVQLSTDNGATWGSPRNVFSKSIFSSDPDLAIGCLVNVGLEDGVVMCAGGDGSQFYNEGVDTYNAIRVSLSGAGNLRIVPFYWENKA